MSSEQEQRLEQVRQLRDKGEAFAYNYDRTHTVQEVLEFNHSDDLPERSFSIAGRVMEIRNFGELAFLDLRGESAQIQLIVREQEELLDTVEDLNRGDIIGVEGDLTYTESNEFSLEVEDLEILTRGVRNIPSDYFGIEDQELRYRDRSLNLISDMDTRDNLRTRSNMIREIRNYLAERQFMEVETPVIQPVYGGANAEPFVTHVNDLDMESYLRISPELYLKRLIIGGYERIFEIGKDFRNESIDTTHNPEFTMMELYQAYADYEDMMELTENLYEHVAVEITGSSQIEYQGETLDLSTPWRRLTMREAIEEHGEIDVTELNNEEIQQRLDEHGIELDSEFERGLAIAELFEELVEENLIQPVHILDHPEETTPLCMEHREKEGMIERFESFAAGMELSNAYTELRDPIRQRELFEDEQRRQEMGDDEAHPIDMDFVNALELGMPPTAGLGIGIDRMVMLITDSKSIRNVITFPMMKN